MKMKYVRTIAETVNSRISNSLNPEEYERAWDGTNQALIETYKSQALPKPAHFLSAYDEQKRKAARRVQTDAMKVAGIDEAMWESCQLLWFRGSQAREGGPIPARDLPGQMPERLNHPEFAMRLFKMGEDPIAIMRKFTLSVWYRAYLENDERVKSNDQQVLKEFRELRKDTSELDHARYGYVDGVRVDSLAAARAGDRGGADAIRRLQTDREDTL